MRKPNLRGRTTTFSRELKPDQGVAVSSNYEDMTPEVPVSITLSERKVEGEDTRCAVIVRFADKNKPALWTNAEQVLGLCLKHSKELAQQFYENGKVMCNIAIGVLKGQIVVAPAS